MDMRIWDRQADIAMHPDEFRDWECYIGLDLASKIDITAMVLLFKRFDQYVLFGYYFLPGDTIEESSNSQYAGWAASNNLISTSGNCVDYTVIEDRLKNFVSKYNVKEIAYDPGFAWDFNQRMFAAGLPMVEVRPSIMNYSEPMKEFEAAILSGRLRHDGNPVATWMVSNVVCHRDAKDNIYPRKEREENKIDGVVAAVAAMSRALADTEGASVYEQRGIITI
jgi:phage terminase large subunit-like protein